MALGRKENEESGLMWFPSLQPTFWLTESHASSHSLKILTRENALKQTARTLRESALMLSIKRQKITALVVKHLSEDQRFTQ